MSKIEVEAAKNLLLNGEIVAIPTETVYGLAGWIYSEDALKKIFEVKERPFFDPLIVHVDSIEKAKALTTEWSPLTEYIANKLWPGPVTLILKKAKDINPLITSGLDSVGIRCPDHPLTLALLKEIPGGLAAPSANKFGKTSPTTFEHVEEEFHGKIPVIDGSQSAIGIESTVLEIIKSGEQYKILIYRPGIWNKEKLAELLKSFPAKIDISYESSPVAPGQIKHHYMPKIPIALVPPHWSREQIMDRLNLLGQEFLRPVELELSTDIRFAARELYEKMRSLSGKGDILFVRWHPHLDSDDFEGIKNRLLKAQSFNLINA